MEVAVQESAVPHSATHSQEGAVRSLLLVDCGAAYTKVALVGLVDQAPRLLAKVSVPTTADAPAQDIQRGIRNAVAQIERITGRPLTSEDDILTPQQPDGTGVDLIAAVCSAGGPLRVALMGPGREAMAGLLARATGGIYAFVEQQGVPEESASHRAPHVTFVAGTPFGAQSSAEVVSQMAATLSAMLSQPTAAAPVVIFCGSREEGTALASALPQYASRMTQSDPLTPATLGPLTRQLNQLYTSERLAAVPGFSQLAPQLGADALAPTTSLVGTARYLARANNMTVVAADVGARSTTIAGATRDGTFFPAAAPAGVAAGAGQTLRAVGAAAISRWLPFPVTEDELREYVLTRMMRSRLLPTTPREVEFEHALARECIRLALQAPGARLAQGQAIDVLLGTGGVLAHVPLPFQAALMLLDAVQPLGVTSLVLDTASLAPMLGSVAAVAPEVAGALAEGDAIPLVLGPVVSISGQLVAGQLAVRTVLDYADGRQHVAEVLAGMLHRLPLRPGERARLSLFPAPTADVGLGAGQQARASELIEGGLLGILIDARGRPLHPAPNSEQGIQQQIEWRRALGLVL